MSKTFKHHASQQLHRFLVMPFSLKYQATEQLHQRWAQHTLDQFTANPSLGSPPTIFVQVDPHLHIANGKYRKRNNRVNLQTTPTTTSDEIHSITAHELGHWAGNKTQSRYYRRLYLEVVTFLLATQLLSNMPAPYGPVLASVAFLGALTVPLRWSRRAEYAADRIAATVIGTAAIVTTLQQANWFNQNVPFTHPRASDRIQVLLQSSH